MKQETIRVLMVDDESVLYHGVRRVLDSFKVDLPELETEAVFEQAWVGTGEEGLQQLTSNTYDLVLLDFKLPGISGLDVMSRLREQKNPPLVVMVTAFASLETAVRATKLGAYDFLSKPFTPDELRYVTKKAVSHILLSRCALAADEEKRRIRFEFLSVLAHELKAPLNAVEGYLQLLQERIGGSEEQTMLSRSLIRLDGMRKLIFDLLDLTRIESGQKKRDLVSLDLVEVVRKVWETVQTDAEKRGVTLTLETVAFPMLADACEMEILLLNLVSNAVKYNRPQGQVEVLLERTEQKIEIKVRDTGIGMSAEESQKLFKEFSRIRNEKTLSISGSGLGLSTVKKLVTLYQGDVIVSSVVDEGSTFHVTLMEPTQAD